MPVSKTVLEGSSPSTPAILNTHKGLESFVGILFYVGRSVAINRLCTSLLFVFTEKLFLVMHYNFVHELMQNRRYQLMDI